MWQELYKKKKISADEAVSLIKNGDRVSIGENVDVAPTLVEAMLRNKDRYRDVEIVHMLPIGPQEYLEPGMETHFKHHTMFCGAANRAAVNCGFADYTPSFYYNQGSITKNELRADVLFVQLTPPDKNGYCSFGTSASVKREAMESAKIVIAELNDQMPYTYGSFVHISDLDYIVESSRPITEFPPAPAGEVEMQIGEICASLIDDGSTLQVGIGAVPEAALKMLRGKRDLGVHTELLGDGLIDLMEAGVVNNKKKSLNPGKCITTLYMGTKKLYDYIDRNPAFEVLPVAYTNDPRVIAQNDRMISINACLQIDLLGQVNSETINGKQYSGIGGQVDFVRGATMSRGGKSILAVNSTTAGGKKSKIVPFLAPGTVVTTSRTDVDYVVTEYGYARLKGKSIRERAKALISIAHPNFRAELTEAFEKAFFKL
ncbi:4-hydroxybutyrate CoA-transferase [Papillibacter cinnamivorans DSM 12816]|uniref:4-hydroxybutyrate CoA-transferase n=2 Tax=Papillibacter TaxID=100175 RepID=A0A1W2C8Z0_9FIRM|nr:4-hydroxybutyrate CoA-transferase [Papillibacter cinnamivorans DSM 12816]